jgi:hypothetical protein
MKQAILVSNLPTIADFALTGCQDCCNVFSTHDHVESYLALIALTGREPTARAVVLHAWGDDADARIQWGSQQDPDDFIDAADRTAKYVAWRDAWLACAERKVAHYMPEWQRLGAS